MNRPACTLHGCPHIWLDLGCQGVCLAQCAGHIKPHVRVQKVVKAEKFAPGVLCLAVRLY
eukprot:1160815-Pelagomonas_calceolata.AAC.5